MGNPTLAIDVFEQKVVIPDQTASPIDLQTLLGWINLVWSGLVNEMYSIKDHMLFLITSSEEMGLMGV